MGIDDRKKKKSSNISIRLIDQCTDAFIYGEEIQPGICRHILKQIDGCTEDENEVHKRLTILLNAPLNKGTF